MNLIASNAEQGCTTSVSAVLAVTDSRGRCLHGRQRRSDREKTWLKYCQCWRNAWRVLERLPLLGRQVQQLARAVARVAQRRGRGAEKLGSHGFGSGRCVVVAHCTAASAFSLSRARGVFRPSVRPPLGAARGVVAAWVVFTGRECVTNLLDAM